MNRVRCEILGRSCQEEPVDGWLPCARCGVALVAVEKGLRRITNQHIVLPNLNEVQGLIGEEIRVRVINGEMETLGKTS